METTSFASHGARCGAWHLRATSGALTTARGRPAVVMAHGFGATRDSGLLPFAERFAAAGLDALVFDYRGFGTSEAPRGRPRQDVDHRRHREDYHAAVAHARGLDGVDPDRVVLWGSSYSGGHVVAVAAADHRVAALVSQGAAMDGLRALRGVQEVSGTGKGASLTAAGLRDLARAVSGRTPAMVPVYGPPGSAAVISSPSAEAGYGAIVGPTFRNEMCARGILRIAANRPVRHAAAVRCPALLVTAEQDDVAPVSSVHEVARRMGDRAEVLSLDVGHFAVYGGEAFERNVARQVEFLEHVLDPGRLPGSVGGDA